MNSLLYVITTSQSDPERCFWDPLGILPGSTRMLWNPLGAFSSHMKSDYVQEALIRLEEYLNNRKHLG